MLLYLTKIPVHGDLLVGQYSQGPVRPKHRKSSKVGNCSVKVTGLYLLSAPGFRFWNFEEPREFQVKQKK